MSSINKAITLFGKVKYASLRKTYTATSSGLPVPKYNYYFRASTHTISLFMNILQETLELKPDILRDNNYST